MKRILSFILSIALVIVLLPAIPTQATITTQSPPNEGWARIRYAGNDRYLDIPYGNFYDNGTQLQLWDKAYGNQNQIFYFHDTGEGWSISSHLTGKVLEVRDSSHDDCAPVAQWDHHELACARWDVIANDDGTASFCNRESGLYLNVCGGGDAQNGTPIIQYHDDASISMRFYIEGMTNTDVLSATFDRYTKVNEVQWTEYNPFANIFNDTGWSYQNNKKYYYPTPNQGLIFDSAEYLSPNTVANILRDKAYHKSTWKQIESALNGELSEVAISELLSSLGFGSIPGLGCALGILQILWDSQNSNKWNEFVDSVQIDKQGRCSGVIIYTYYDITTYSIWGPLNNGSTTWGTTWHIRKVPYIEYKTWSGNNFSDVCNLPVNVIDGRWWYYFK